MSAWGAVSISLPITGRGAFMIPILRIGGVLAVLAVNTTMENTTVQRRKASNGNQVTRPYQYRVGEKDTDYL
jgi:hypothetical protein